VLVVAFWQPPPALADDQYTVTELGRLWADESRATGINDAGQVVSSTETLKAVALGPDDELSAVRTGLYTIN
jgi:hypothetical protein